MPRCCRQASIPVAQAVLLLLCMVFSYAKSTDIGPTRPINRPLPEILGEEFAYKRWRTILERSIRMPDGKVLDFDLVGMAGGSSAVVVFAWDTSTKTATLVREYHPGPHCFLFGAAAGIVEHDKHDGDAELAAQHELEEECHLSGGTWYLLTPQPLAMDKYATTKIRAFLVMDAKHVPDPRPQDHEEDIEIIRNVTVEEIMNMIRRGEVNVVGCWACLMAIKKLRELGEIE